MVLFYSKTIYVMIEHQQIDHINWYTDTIKGESRGAAFVL